MKQLICVGLAAVLLGLCACAGQPPAAQSESGPPPPRQGPVHTADKLLSQVYGVLTGGETPLSVTLEGVPDTAGQRVAVSPALRQAMANALVYGAYSEESDASPAGQTDTAQSADGESGGQDGEIAIAGRGEPTLYATARRQGEGCLVWVQLGEDSAEYTYPAAVYDFLLAQAQAALVPNTLDLAGALQPLATPAAPAGFTAQWMECDGGLAGLYTWFDSEDSSEKRSALEIFDPSTGESLYYHDIGTEALRMEAATFSGTDMRVVMADGAMWYLNSQNPDSKPYYFYLPKALRSRLLSPYPMDRAVFRSFDGGTGQGAVWAVVDEEGITWARRSSGGTIANEEILEHITQELYDGTGVGTAPQFGEVRVMNGGATLVATVMLPQSQMGQCGLFTYTISSGASEWYFGMFRPMMADLRFLDDTHLVVAGEEEIFRLNVASGQSTTSPAPENIITAATPDYERYVFTDRQLNFDGTETIALTTEGGEIIAGATGGGGMDAPLRIEGVTGRYVVLRTEDEGAERWHIARW